MLDEDGMVSIRARRAAMGADSSARLDDCFVLGGSSAGRVREERVATQPIGIPSTDVSEASVRRRVLPVGASQQRSDRLFASAHPVPLCVIFGTGDADAEDDVQAICPTCFRERWQCRCVVGEGISPR